MRAPPPPPAFLKLLATGAVAMACLSAATARAEVVSFYFSGTVGVTILESGLVQDVGISNTDWLGRTVAGMVVKPADAEERAYPTPSRGRYSRAEIFPYTGWMSLSVLQPDGSLAMIPASELARPAPAEDRGDAFTLLVDPVPRDWSYARPAGTAPATAALEAIVLALRAVEMDRGGAVEADFAALGAELEETAPRRLHGPDGREEGGWGSDLAQVALATRPLPEPSALALCASGLLAVAAVFRRGNCN